MYLLRKQHQWANGFRGWEKEKSVWYVYFTNTYCILIKCLVWPVTCNMPAWLFSPLKTHRVVFGPAQHVIFRCQRGQLLLRPDSGKQHLSSNLWILYIYSICHLLLWSDVSTKRPGTPLKHSLNSRAQLLNINICGCFYAVTKAVKFEQLLLWLQCIFIHI